MQKTTAVKKNSCRLQHYGETWVGFADSFTMYHIKVDNALIDGHVACFQSAKVETRYDPL